MNRNGDTTKRSDRDMRPVVRELLVADRRVRPSRPGLIEQVRATASRSATAARRSVSSSARCASPR